MAKTLREYMNTARKKEVRAWAVAVMNAAALLAVHAAFVGTYDGDIAERYDRCCEELLFSFEHLPQTKGD